MYESSPVQTTGAVTEITPAQITDQTVIVDARPAFDYSLAHINGSLALRWQDFTQREEARKGLLEGDLFFHARRLARMGIDPSTPVIVVGRGPFGEGEEGRVAWTLKYLGLKDVKFVHVDAFKLPHSQAEAAPRPAKPLWKPSLQEDLDIEVKPLLNNVQKGALAGRPIFIDVRTEKEYLGKGQFKSVPDLGVINIPWTEFITSQSLPNKEVVAKLETVGITKDKKIILLDEMGVRSAMVTLVLRDLGYSKATNFSGGYILLSNIK